METALLFTPPNEFIWYQDKDIIGYKIKESWLMDENGEIFKKSIVALAPVKNVLDQNGDIIGQTELFWVDFSEIRDILSNYYIYDRNSSESKVMSFEKYFDQRKFSSTIIQQDSLHVK